MNKIYSNCPTLVQRMRSTQLQFFKAECLSEPLKMRQYILHQDRVSTLPPPSGRE